MRSELVHELHSTRGQSIVVPEYTGSPTEGYWWLLDQACGSSQVCAASEKVSVPGHTAEMPVMFTSCKALKKLLIVKW